MDFHAAVKLVHILSAAVLFGTGLGIAFFFWSARGASDQARLYAARTTVTADLLFSLPAVFVQPASGIALVVIAGWSPWEFWLLATYALYVLAGLCWLPVAWLQWRMREMLAIEQQGGGFDAVRFEALWKWWFRLGWPAFGAVIAIYGLMVAKPSW